MDLIPQLAETIDKAKLPEYINDDNFSFEQKVDGWRKLVWLRGGDIEPLNRQGKPADLPQNVWDSLPRISDPQGVCLDCELVGDVLWIFDMPFAVGQVTPDQPYSWRREVLDKFAPLFESEYVQLLPSARTAADKFALSRRVITAGGEGLVVKDNRAAFQSGKRHRGVLKAKFTKSVDCVITRFGVGLSSNGSGLPKQNAEIALYDNNGELRVIGECIIHTAERKKADIGSVCEVTYLYCLDPTSPRLVQPTRLKIRDDKDPKDCVMSQLRPTSKEVHDFRP